MANRPVNAGSGAAAAPPPVHHDAATAAPAGHRAARTARTARAARDPRPSKLAWLPYLIVLAGAATGMLVVWQGSKYAGCEALARLILPERYAGLLASRRKATDVLGFAVFGAAVLAVAIALP